MRPILLFFFFAYAFAQSPAFEAASIRASKSIVGHDGAVSTNPGHFTARNATLKRLIVEAYQVPYSQVKGGPNWLDSAEYEVEAKSASPATPDQLKPMLQALLTERFKLMVHRETTERRVYELSVEKDGPRLSSANPGNWRFHGDLTHFADRLAIQLTIPFLDDPTTPSHASGAPIPVLNKTGIEGDHDFRLEIKPEAGADPFTIWQRALREQLGLKLSSQKGRVELLVIDRAEKIPTDN